MRGCLTFIITAIILVAFGGNCFSSDRDISTDIAWRSGCRKPGRPPLVHMDCNYHSTDYITKDSCQSKSHYCKLYL
jgi:hypothetical protein